MKIQLKEAADLIGGKIFGQTDISFSNIARIDEAQPGDLTFLYLPNYEKYFAGTKASIILVKRGFEHTRDDITYVEVEKPNVALHKIITSYFMPEIELSGIDESAYVHPSAVLGENIALGKNVVVSDGCVIGDNTKIFHNTVLLKNVLIGADSLIFQNVSIREDCKIGDRAIIHPGVVIGSDGFGFSPDEKGVYQKIPQIGVVEIGNDVEIGANCAIDRAAIGKTIIGNGVKMDNFIQIAHNVEVGDNTVLSAQSGISGSTKVGKNCILAGQVGVAGHIQITDGVIIGAQSGVSKSLKTPGKYFGYPAKEMRTSLRLEGHYRNLPKYSERIKELENKLAELEKKFENKKEK
jgi:UDP-3-O-[3-hydroxymyristoyl] glucosamine N-acyltransferase